MTVGAKGGSKTADAIAERGDDVPELLQQPEVPAHRHFEWRAFWTLSNCRPVGMSEAPISFTDIAAYCVLYGVADRDSMDAFVHLVKALDSEYLAVASERASDSASRKPRGRGAQR